MQMLDRQLQGVMEAMNIPKAKQQGLLVESDEKKWQLVWGHMATTASNPPGYYLNQLISYDSSALSTYHSIPRQPAHIRPTPFTHSHLHTVLN